MSDFQAQAQSMLLGKLASVPTEGADISVTVIWSRQALFAELFFTHRADMAQGQLFKTI